MKSICATLGLLLVASLVGCAVDRAANPARRCDNDDGCADDERCYGGYCIGDGAASVADGGLDAARGDGSKGGSDGGDAGGENDAAGTSEAGQAADGGGDAGNAPEACDAEGEEDFCYEGPDGTDLVGRCRPGKHTCSGGFFGPCNGQVLPADGEICNGMDDDCDGTIDEDAAAASCDTGMLGACGEGVLVCAGGSGVCTQAVAPDSEICNGMDDDCDGMTDEGGIANPRCYDGTSGCADGDGDGDFTCAGTCRAGVETCDNGVPQACSGQVMPAAAEDCDAPNDEDCDGAVDEQCSCSPGQTRDCYSGPGGTAGVGTCMLGERTCEGGQWAPCTGQVVPVAETCLNIGFDDDCDGELDDVPDRGTPCSDPDAVGRCAKGVRDCVNGQLACVTPDAREETCDSTDDDCDGAVDEGFNVFDDEQNCGSCGHVCAASQTCCSGTCYDLNSDNSHCGSCTTVCSALTGCCNGACQLLSLGC